MARINEDGVLTLSRTDLEEMIARLDELAQEPTLEYVTWIMAGEHISFEED